jgi:hypothetical protein
MKERTSSISDKPEKGRENGHERALFTPKPCFGAKKQFCARRNSKHRAVGMTLGHRSGGACQRTSGR